MNPRISQRNRRERGHTVQRTRSVRRGGFTLVEVLVALAIFALMMAIIFVPLRLGFNSFTAGNTRAQVQAAANQTAARMETELRTAMFVYSNDSVSGISNRVPYSNVAQPASGTKPEVTYALPYLRQAVAGSTVGACDAGSGGVIPVANLGRVDFVPPKRDTGGNIIIPLRPADYVVTYYARRLDPSKPFDLTDNPIVLFRAQTPFKKLDGNVAQLADFSTTTTPPSSPPGVVGPSNAFNLNPQDSRYPNFNPGGSATTLCGGSNKAATDRGSRWLLQNVNNEPDLEGLTKTDPDTNAFIGGGTNGDIVGSHTLLTPRGMEIVAPRAGLPTPDYTPTTTFTCEDTDGDGRINRITVRLFLASATNDGQVNNGVPLIQSQGLPQVIDLPNVR